MTFRWQEAIHQCHNKGQAFVVATILTTAGSTPRDGGSKMVVTEKDGYDSVGGGRLDERARGARGGFRFVHRVDRCV